MNTKLFFLMLVTSTTAASFVKKLFRWGQVEDKKDSTPTPLPPPQAEPPQQPQPQPNYHQQNVYHQPDHFQPGFYQPAGYAGFQQIYQPPQFNAPPPGFGYPNQPSPWAPPNQFAQPQPFGPQAHPQPMEYPWYPNSVPSAPIMTSRGDAQEPGPDAPSEEENGEEDLDKEAEDDHMEQEDDHGEEENGEDGEGQGDGGEEEEPGEQEMLSQADPTFAQLQLLLSQRPTTTATEHQATTQDVPVSTPTTQPSEPAKPSVLNVVSDTLASGYQAIKAQTEFMAQKLKEQQEAAAKAKAEAAERARLEAIEAQRIAEERARLEAARRQQLEEERAHQRAEAQATFNFQVQNLMAEVEEEIYDEQNRGQKRKREAESVANKKPRLSTRERDRQLGEQVKKQMAEKKKADSQKLKERQKERAEAQKMLSEMNRVKEAFAGQDLGDPESRSQFHASMKAVLRKYSPEHLERYLEKNPDAVSEEEEEEDDDDDSGQARDKADLDLPEVPKTSSSSNTIPSDDDLMARFAALSGKQTINLPGEEDDVQLEQLKSITVPKAKSTDTRKKATANSE